MLDIKIFKDKERIKLLYVDVFDGRKEKEIDAMVVIEDGYYFVLTDKLSLDGWSARNKHGFSCSYRICHESGSLSEYDIHPNMEDFIKIYLTVEDYNKGCHLYDKEHK